MTPATLTNQVLNPRLTLAAAYLSIKRYLNLKGGAIPRLTHPTAYLVEGSLNSTVTLASPAITLVC